MQRVAAASAADEPPGLPAPPRADPWAIPDATPEILRELDREIAERGLSEPALCCCEYAEAVPNTGSKHVSHHCCDCDVLERHACVILSGPCNGKAWGVFCAALASKSLIPFPGGAIRVPPEGLAVLTGYILISFSSFSMSALQTAIATLLLLVFIGRLNVQLTTRWRYRTELFTTWFLVSVLHDIRMLLQIDFTIQSAPPKLLVGLLLFSGAIMLALLYFTRRSVSPGVIRRCGARFEENADGRVVYCTDAVLEGTGMRSKHCGICDHRLNTFDHHCAFINACVAGRNHRYFLGFLSISVCNSVSFSWIDYSYHEFVLSSVACYNLILSAFLMLLLCFQCILVSVNLTTNEFINRSRYVRFRGGANPHNEGFLANWRSFLLGSRYVPRSEDIAARQGTSLRNNV